VSHATRGLFASDLHGSAERYRKLFAIAAAERPLALFLGGDLLPCGPLLSATPSPAHRDFLSEVLAPGLERLRGATRVFAVLGNDDPRTAEAGLLDLAVGGLLTYVHGRRAALEGYAVYGYAFVPPTPFLLKDWERYDVSRFVDPGCVSPEEGHRTVPVPELEVRWGTIAADLALLAGDDDLSRSVFLFHSPPYDTRLDRAALDGREVDHAPVDVHVGSIAIRRFLERIGRTVCLSEINYQRTGTRSDGLLDVHYLTDEDIEARTSYAVKIGAVTDAARMLPLGE
jgi:Icc-related predicted phosphoesterase